MRRIIAITFGAILFLAACGSGGGESGTQTEPDAVGSSGGGSKTANIEPCGLLTQAELTAVLGEAPPPEESEPAGPFTGCSWGTGDVIVSIATSDTVILAPGEDECPSAGLGDESYLCEQRVKILTNGIHLTVSTINAFVEDSQLVELASTVLPKLPD